MKYIKASLFVVVTILLVWSLIHGIGVFPAIMMWITAWFLLMKLGEK